MNFDPSLRAIFNEALDRSDAVERAAYLDGACGADAALRERVEKLLRAHDEAEGFFAEPNSRPQSDAAITALFADAMPMTEKPGDMIGRYKLLQQIGEGGCGVVYMAEQEEPVRRRVALKVIKLGMDTKQVIARFEAERQALAMMDHPNIAKIFDAGVTDAPLPASDHPLPVGRGEGQGEGSVNSQPSTPNPQLSPGRPFFVMELVRGLKITEFCDQKKLSTHERLELFLQVCAAIQHAHQKGIIHRDLKPSNILVTMIDGVPVPKIIDFGIAKATNNQRLTDKTLFTAFEQFIGTPAYMSPEQAEMSGVDIDTRTDIYSLGVVLYELLTGRTPFDAETLLRSGIDGIRRTIREQEPPKPSTRLHTLAHADLTTIAQARQTDAPRLVHQVQGDLDWVVMKCLEKDRNRRYESVNGLAMDVQRHLQSEPVVARPPTGTYRMQKLIRRNKIAFAAGTAVLLVLLGGITVSTWQAVRATRAEREQSKLRRSAEKEAVRSSQATRFLQSILGAVNPRIADGHDTTLLRLMLESAARRVSTELEGQPDVEADMRTTIGDAFVMIEQSEKGEQMHREALRLRQMLHGPEHLEVSWSLHRLAGAYAQRGKHADALAASREALRMRRKLLEAPDVQTAQILSEMVWPLQSEGHHAEAVSAASEALDICVRLLGDQDLQVATSTAKLGAALMTAGNLVRAEAETLKAQALLRKSGQAESSAMAQAVKTLGKIQLTDGRPAEAEATLHEASALITRSYGSDSGQMVDTFIFLSQSLAAQGRLEEAEEFARQAVTIREIKADAAHPHHPWALQNLEQILWQRGDYAAAEPVARKRVEFQQKHHGSDNEKVAAAMESLARVLRAAGKSSEADDEQQKAGAIRITPANARATPGKTTARELWTAGERAARKGNWAFAADAFTRAASADIQILADHKSTLRLASVLIETRDMDAYRSLCESVTDATATVDHPSQAVCLSRSGLLASEAGLALDECSRLANLAVETGKDSSLFPWYQATQALSEYRCGRFENAIKVATECLADRRTHTACRVLAGPVLAMAHHQAGRAEEARFALNAATNDHGKGWFDARRTELDHYWHDWLIGHILLREARGLIEGSASTAPKTDDALQ